MRAGREGIAILKNWLTGAPSNMEASKATLADVEKLRAFFLQAWSETGPGSLGFAGATDQTINQIASEEFLKERLANPNVNIYKVEDRERVLGVAATRKIDENTVELSGIIVLESATEKGIGTQLFAKVIYSAREVGFHKIIVKTEIVNKRAIAFYKKMGLAEVGKATENVEGTNVDVVVLEKAIE